MKLLVKISLAFYIVTFTSISFAQEIIQFFPNKIFSENKNDNEFRVELYSKHLISMDEPSLWNFSKNSNNEIYRFLWLRTFDSPIVIRLEIDTTSKASLFIKSTNGHGGYEAGKLIDNYRLEINRDSLVSFINLIRSSNFWQLPTNKLMLATDGSQWILEGIKKSKYHLVDRYGGDEIRKLCLFLLSMSKSDFGEVY